MDPNFGTAHPRANSFGSLSSTESAHVDWDELDKNERQEQQDEGSDDVSICKGFCYTRMSANNTSLQHFCSLGSNKKTTL